MITHALRLVKSIFHPHRVKDCKDPHIMIYKEGFTQVNSNKTPIEFSTAPVVIDKIRINHYWTRDEAYFFEVKVPRQWREGFVGIENRLNGLNKVHDGTILRFAAPLRVRMNLNKL